MSEGFRAVLAFVERTKQLGIRSNCAGNLWTGRESLHLPRFDLLLSDTHPSDGTGIPVVVLARLQLDSCFCLHAPPAGRRAGMGNPLGFRHGIFPCAADGSVHGACALAEGVAGICIGIRKLLASAYS